MVRHCFGNPENRKTSSFHDELKPDAAISLVRGAIKQVQHFNDGEADEQEVPEGMPSHPITASGKAHQAANDN